VLQDKTGQTAGEAGVQHKVMVRAPFWSMLAKSGSGYSGKVTGSLQRSLRYAHTKQKLWQVCLLFPYLLPVDRNFCPGENYISVLYIAFLFCLLCILVFKCSLALLMTSLNYHICISYTKTHLRLYEVRSSQFHGYIFSII